ncbi:O-antigen ligase family protein [Pseudonocardia endophytica]|nr:O-antigen ligase family protein [Pseudonocardia endophytica]
MGGALATSFLVAQINGISPESWLRDALPYILLIGSPIIALGAVHDLSRDWCFRMIAVVGVISAVAFAVDWLSRRGVSTLPVSRFAFGSAAMIAFAFGFLLVRALLRRRHRIWWGAAALLMPLSILITGSRTALILFAAVGAAIGPLARERIPPIRAVMCVGAAALIVWTALPVLGSALISNPEFLGSRIEAAERVLTGSADADQSYEGRASQTTQAAGAIANAPVFGVGLGHQFEVPGRDEPNRSNIDSPLGPVAKLGLFGTGALVCFLAALVRPIVIGSRERPDFVYTACWSFVVLFLVQIPFGSFVEDKGLSFAVLLFVAVTAATAYGRRSKAPVLNGKSVSAPPGAVRSSTLK